MVEGWKGKSTASRTHPASNGSTIFGDLSNRKDVEASTECGGEREKLKETMPCVTN